MNKEKIVEFKNKLKEHVPEIVIVSGLALMAYGLHGFKKQIRHLDDVEFEPFKMVDRETQQKLMEDESFGLYKLTDDEYMFARIIEE